ncbi:MAG: DUF1453 domain-containing protein [Pseudomonadota bacterium]
MQVQTAQPNQWISYAITAAIVGLVLFIRVRRMSKERPLKLEYLWIFPALYLVIATVMLVEIPPSPVGWAICAAALLVGGAIGWQRGKAMRITVDPETHALNQKASIAGILFIVAIIVVRQIAGAEGRALGHQTGAMITDGLVVFALGLFSLARLEMYLRASRLLEEARAVRARG